MTSRFGPHRRVARRPPDPDIDVADIPEDMEVVRLECLDCGHELQSLRQVAEFYLTNEIPCGDRHPPGAFQSIEVAVQFLAEVAGDVDPYKRDWGQRAEEGSE